MKKYRPLRGEATEIPVGTRVEIVKLPKRPDMNGKKGYVLKLGKKGWCKVKLDRGGSGVYIRFDFLRVLE